MYGEPTAPTITSLRAMKDAKSSMSILYKSHMSIFLNICVDLCVCATNKATHITTQDLLTMFPNINVTGRIQAKISYLMPSMMVKLGQIPVFDLVVSGGRYLTGI